MNLYAHIQLMQSRLGNTEKKYHRIMANIEESKEHKKPRKAETNRGMDNHGSRRSSNHKQNTAS